jgi:uncharacterized protein YwqG
VDNYRQQRPLRSLQDYLDLAALMLETMVRLCDLQPGETLVYDAPGVPEPPKYIAAALKRMRESDGSPLLTYARFCPEWARDAQETRIAAATRDLSKLEPAALIATAVDNLGVMAATEHTGHYNRLFGRSARIAEALRKTEQGKVALLALLTDRDPAIRLRAAQWCRPFDRAASLAAFRNLAERTDKIGKEAQGSLRWAAEAENPHPQAPKQPDRWFNRTRNVPPRGTARANLELRLRAVFPDDLAARLIDLIRPAIRLWPRRPPERLSPTASRLGGMPAVPSDWKWPIYRGEPLFFLGQINCADLRDLTGADALPKSGLLAFFGDHDTIMGCGECEGAVFAWPEVEQLTPAKAPVDHFEILPVCALHFIETSELPDFRSTAIRQLALSTAQRDAYFKMQQAAVRLGLAEADHHADGISKLLGWPNLVQRDVDAMTDPAGKQRLLAQIGDYENGTDSQVWGPGGLIYFTIGARDLARHRFDQAAIEMQCR